MELKSGCIITCDGHSSMIDQDIMQAWVDMVEDWNPLQIACLKKAIDLVEKNRVQS